MLIISNGRLVTRDASLPFFENGAVAVEGTKIVEVGENNVLLGKYSDAEIVDAKGGVIMPGLINMHNHIYSAFARGLNMKGATPNKNFLEILENMWWRIDRTLNSQDNYWSAVATYIDCIKSGVTTVFDHHASFGEVPGSLFEVARAAEELGVRTNLCYEISDRDGEVKSDESVQENIDFILDCQKKEGDMVKGMMGMHASFTISDKTMEKCRNMIPEGTGYHIHVAEGMDDVYLCLKEHGKRVINRLFDWGILGEKTITAHCIHIDSHEMELLKESNTMVVHNPESNMGNAVGCPPVIELMKRGIPVGLGTDGYTNDMFESYKVANILHKHHLGDPSVAWGEIPEALFDNNPNFANRYFETQLGVLKEGAAADIIVADYNPLTPMDASNINSHVLFGMNGRSIATTVINGVVKMKDRELVGVDEERLMAQAREQAQSLWSRINA